MQLLLTPEQFASKLAVSKDKRFCYFVVVVTFLVTLKSEIWSLSAGVAATCLAWHPRREPSFSIFPFLGSVCLPSPLGASSLSAKQMAYQLPPARTRLLLGGSS